MAEEQTETTVAEGDSTDQATFDDKLAAAGFDVADDEGRAADGDDGGDSSDVEDDGRESADAQTTDDEATEPTFTTKELNAAQRAGFDEDFLTALGDRARPLVENLVKSQSDIGRRYAKIGQAERNARKREEETGKESADEERKPLFDPAEYEGDEYATAFNTMDGRVHQLEGQLAQFSQDKQEQDDMRAMKDADAWLGQLEGKGFEELGDGPTMSLDPDSPEYEARAKLYGKADQLQVGFRAAEGEDMAQEEALAQAFAILYPGAQTEAKRDKKQEAIDRRKKQKTARPTGRKTTRQYNSADERTAEALDDYEKEHDTHFFLPQ